MAVSPEGKGRMAQALRGAVSPSQLRGQELLHADSRASATAIPARRASFVPHTNCSKAGNCAQSHTDIPGLEHHRQTCVSSELWSTHA